MINIKILPNITAYSKLTNREIICQDFIAYSNDSEVFAPNTFAVTKNRIDGKTTVEMSETELNSYINQLF